MHDCVNCGCACYCHGDIDDCQVETWQHSSTHCTGCGCSEDDEFMGYDDPDDCNPPASGGREPQRQQSPQGEK